MLDPLAAGCRARLGVRTAGGELRLQLRLSCPPAHADSSRIQHTRYTVGNATTQVKEADSMDPVVEMQGTTPAPTSEEIDRLRLRYGFWIICGIFDAHAATYFPPEDTPITAKRSRRKASANSITMSGQLAMV